MTNKSILVKNDYFEITKTMYESGMYMPSHSHNHTSISVVLQGHLTEKVEGACKVGATAQTIIKPKGVAHENYFSKECHILSLSIKNERLVSGKKDSTLREWGWLSNADSIRFFCSLTQCENYDQIKSEFNRFRLKIYNQSTDTKNAPPTWLQNVKNFIDSNFQAGIKTNNLAQKFSVHPVYLSRAFKNHFGHSIKAYVNLLRIHHACYDISNESPLTDIAFNTGFSDQSHFNRKFKETMKITPSDFRKRFKIA